MGLPIQDVITTHNRRWLGEGKRFLDKESISYLDKIAPEAGGRLIDGSATGESHQDAMNEARTYSISYGQPYGVLVPIDVITSKYFRDLINGLAVNVHIGCGRIKTIEHEKNRAATGSAVVVFIGKGPEGIVTDYAS
jgi:hypothetical protein